jgi:hypothetical protein
MEFEIEYNSYQGWQNINNLPFIVFFLNHTILIKHCSNHCSKYCTVLSNSMLLCTVQSVHSQGSYNNKLYNFQIISEAIKP